MILVQSILVLGSIGVVAGIILTVAYSYLKVQDAPLVEQLLEVLPGSNCGACGYASCHEYAVAINKKDAGVGLCKAGGAELGKSIAEIMGVEHTEDDATKKAIVRCQVRNRKYLASYNGPSTCASSQLLGGGMACKYGCLGYGDCISVCPFDAIHLNKNLIPVIDLNKCTGCGLCVKACPRDIIVLRQVVDSSIVYVGCNNTQSGKDTRKVCDAGCIACKICEKKAPEGSFVVENNLAEVVKQSPKIIINDIKCPAGCIHEVES